MPQGKMIDRRPRAGYCPPPRPRSSSRAAGGYRRCCRAWDAADPGVGNLARTGHADPRGAAQAAALLRPSVVAPIHWATYLPLGYCRRHPLLRDPGPTFAAQVAELAPDVRVALVRLGESVDL